MELKLLAVDPGELYVGIAEFVGWEVMNTSVLPPNDAVDMIWRGLENGHYDQVVMESWRTYTEALWTECLTVEVIGAVKHKARQCGVPVKMQPNTIKRPAAARMLSHGIEFPASLAAISTVRLRQHPTDACMHGYWWLFENPPEAA